MSRPEKCADCGTPWKVVDCLSNLIIYGSEPARCWPCHRERLGGPPEHGTAEYWRSMYDEALAAWKEEIAIRRRAEEDRDNVSAAIATIRADLPTYARLQITLLTAERDGLARRVEELENEVDALSARIGGLI